MNEAPFPPSWQNRFFRAVERGPVPGWLIYLLLFAGLAFISHLVPWIEGTLPWGMIDAYQFNFHVWYLMVFFFGSYFTVYPRQALARFRPALDLPEGEFRRLAWEFTTLGSRSGWIITVAAALAAPFSLSLAGDYSRLGFAAILWLAISVFMSSLVFFFFVYLVRVLRMVARLYARVEHVNLFHLDPCTPFPA